MAAPYSRCLRKSWRKPVSLFHQQIRHSYIVLIPEIPPDTAETNSLMRCTSIPNYGDVTRTQMMNGIVKLAQQYEAAVDSVGEKCKDPGIQKSIESLLHPIEEKLVPLEFGWKQARNLYYCNSKLYRDAFAKGNKYYQVAKNERWGNFHLYLATKELGKDNNAFSEQQRHMVKTLIHRGRCSGVELLGEDKLEYNNLMDRLEGEQRTYWQKVSYCTRQFYHVINDPLQVADLPESLRNQLAVDPSQLSQGPWRLSLTPSVYSRFLEHSSNRELRFNLWRAYNTRASALQNDRGLSNGTHIEMIRSMRKAQAHNLAFKSFAAMSLSSKMAGSIDSVASFIESMRQKFADRAKEEVAQLTQFAKSEGYSGGPLKLWDIPYWKRRSTLHRFKLEEKMTVNVNKALNVLFDLSNSLFGVQFKDKSESTPRWHPSVTVYECSENGKTCGHLFIDPGARPGEKATGIWALSGRDRSAVVGTTPIACMGLDLTSEELSMEDTEQLFRTFGQVLTILLTRSDYCETSGQQNLELDVQPMCGYLMENFLYQPSILGQLIPPGSVQAAVQARRHMGTFGMMRQLYLSAFDLEMYMNEKQWSDVQEDLWPRFMPIPLDKEDFQPCSFTQIFSENFAASYYTHKWAEMLAADCHAAFQESDPAQVGRRFRDLFLAHGGCLPAEELFRRFRGRDPIFDHLIKSYSS